MGFNCQRIFVNLQYSIDECLKAFMYLLIKKSLMLLLVID